MFPYRSFFNYKTHARARTAAAIVCPPGPPTHAEHNLETPKQTAGTWVLLEHILCGPYTTATNSGFHTRVNKITLRNTAVAHRARFKRLTRIRLQSNHKLDRQTQHIPAHPSTTCVLFLSFVQPAIQEPVLHIIQDSTISNNIYYQSMEQSSSNWCRN